jgi:hypothetical protein
MSALKTFARFWYDFVVGDDWRLAGAAIGAIALAFAAAHAGMPAWPVLPTVVAVALTWSVLRT